MVKLHETPEAPELPAACCGLHGPAAGEPGKRLPSAEVIHDKLNQLLIWGNQCVIR